MDIRFSGKTVIVTGAAHGFGRQVALRFAELGGVVWACDVLQDELDETRRLCQGTAGSCEVLLVDVTDREAVFDFVSQASSESGQVDILVNNAGGVLGQAGKPLEEVSAAEWQGLFDVNVTAAFTFSQAVAPVMKEARAGRIINISSGAGLGGPCFLSIFLAALTPNWCVNHLEALA